MLREYFWRSRKVKESALRKLTEEEKKFCLENNYVYRNSRGLFLVSEEGFLFLDEDGDEIVNNEIYQLHYRNSVLSLSECWMDYTQNKLKSSRAREKKSE